MKSGAEIKALGEPPEGDVGRAATVGLRLGVWQPVQLYIRAGLFLAMIKRGQCSQAMLSSVAGLQHRSVCTFVYSASVCQELSVSWGPCLVPRMQKWMWHGCGLGAGMATKKDDAEPGGAHRTCAAQASWDLDDFLLVSAPPELSTQHLSVAVGRVTWEDSPRHRH